MTERPDGIEVETTRCLECGATRDRIDIPAELVPFVNEWTTLHREVPVRVALERWMDEKRTPESKRNQLREQNEAFLAAIMEDYAP
jgi:hypothetical protein